MTTRRFLVVLAVVGTPVFLYAQLRDERGERERLQAEVARLAAAQERAARVAAQDAPARAVLEGLAARSAGARAPLESPAAPAATPAAAAAPAVEPHVFFDGVFAAQRASNDWADSAQRLATTRLTAALPPASALRAVECRESLCRIETEHADRDHYQQFFQHAFMDSATQAWNGAVTTVELETAGDGSIHAVSYLMREGVALPRPQRDGAVAASSDHR